MKCPESINPWTRRSTVGARGWGRGRGSVCKMRKFWRQKRERAPCPCTVHLHVTPSGLFYVMCTAPHAHQKERCPGVCLNRDEARRHRAPWKKPDLKSHVLRDSIYGKCPQRTSPETVGGGQWWSGAGATGEMLSDCLWLQGFLEG